MDPNEDPTTMSATQAADMLCTLLATVKAGVCRITGGDIQPNLEKTVGQRLDDFLHGQLSAHEATRLIHQDITEWLFQRDLVDIDDTLSTLEVEIFTLLVSYKTPPDERS